MQLEQPDYRTEQLEELSGIFLLISYIMLSLNNTSIKSPFLLIQPAWFMWVLSNIRISRTFNISCVKHPLCQNRRWITVQANFYPATRNTGLLESSPFCLLNPTVTRALTFGILRLDNFNLTIKHVSICGVSAPCSTDTWYCNNWDVYILAISQKTCPQGLRLGLGIACT